MGKGHNRREKARRRRRKCGKFIPTADRQKARAQLQANIAALDPMAMAGAAGAGCT